MFERKVNAKIKRNMKKWVDRKGYHEFEKSLEMVAEEFEVSDEQLSYFCSKVLGESFLTLRKRLRIEEAMKILRKDREINFAALSILVGIPNKSNFRTQFREFVGMTPAEYRQYHSLSLFGKLVFKIKKANRPKCK